MTGEQTAAVEARQIETVTGDFHTEPGKPFYRVEIDGYCADFDYREAAENFAQAINRRTATLQATVEHQAAEIARLRHKLDLAAGRLNWASVANPGARTDEGRRLLATWADEARQALGDTNAS